MEALVRDKGTGSCDAVTGPTSLFVAPGNKKMLCPAEAVSVQLLVCRRCWRSPRWSPTHLPAQARCSASRPGEHTSRYLFWQEVMLMDNIYLGYSKKNEGSRVKT
ncbi:hypothetical protein HaLaN_18579, partial [Haematococcus lacustris]